MSVRRRIPVLFLCLGLFLLGLAVSVQGASAGGRSEPAAQASPIHPTFVLQDADGRPVIESGGPVSTVETCGACHDTDFIQSHSFHTDVGLASYQPISESLDASPGLFGKWDPLGYRFLSRPGDERLDLSTAEWLMRNGDRLVGGGPATFARTGQPLTSLSPDSHNPEASLLDSATGEVSAWDWSESGVLEMNCFLCHLESPNNSARVEMIRSGEFGTASTATLLGTGIVTRTSTGWFWNDAAFDAQGQLRPQYVRIQDPTNQNCGQCHGAVHTDISLPLVLEACNWETATTGQIISPQRISESGMNIASKAEAYRSWDVHAERQLNCTDCHFSLNNPAYAQTDPGAPTHLTFDPRRLEVGEYLERPDHNIARGQSAQYGLAPELKGTMRRCESCHDAQAGHAEWLPYVDRHMDAVACETCHIPRMYAPAIQSYDWTVLLPTRAPVSVCRGIDISTSQRLTASADPNAAPLTVNYLVKGYEPVLLNRVDSGGDALLAPYNLITSFYWLYEDAEGGPRPVRLIDLEAVYLEGGGYAPEVISVFDANRNGAVDAEEMVIDTQAKLDLIAGRLSALGLKNPRIAGRVQPYSISHSVAGGEHALDECRACHSDSSRIGQPIKLTDAAPLGAMPEIAAGTNILPSGRLVQDAQGALYYEPLPADDQMYVLGSSRVHWVDWFGGLAFAGTLLGVGVHGLLRFLTGRRRPRTGSRTEMVYMYESYRRFWHWLQTTAIVVLLLTGLIIHRPQLFGAFSFHGVVVVHNVLAVILVVNAALSVFYHLVSGRLREYVPRPYGFFDDAILQARYYARGIFRGEPHPFQKTPARRMNPLQQATYFGILNVLLPLQIVSGILMWAVGRWPETAAWLGGLSLLAPLHALVAWLFAAFIVAHVYLTTTGATPLEATRAMVTGWEHVQRGHD